MATIVDSPHPLGQRAITSPLLAPIPDWKTTYMLSTWRLQALKGVSPNLSTHQIGALGKLSENKDLVIKKGLTIVVLDKQDYMEKGFEHLSDHETYRELGQDTTMEVVAKVTSTVRANNFIQITRVRPCVRACVCHGCGRY